MALDQDFMVTIQGEPVPWHTISLSSGSDLVFQVDVDRAWYELDAHSGWNNDVRIQVSFST